MKGIDIFDLWVTLSLVITGPAHVVFAALCVKRARQLASGRTAMPHSRIFNITVAVSCILFLLLVIPPVLVAITLLPIVPLLYRMQRVVDRERGPRVVNELPCTAIADYCTMNKNIIK